MARRSTCWRSPGWGSPGCSSSSGAASARAGDLPGGTLPLVRRRDAVPPGPRHRAGQRRHRARRPGGGDHRQGPARPGGGRHGPGPRGALPAPPAGRADERRAPAGTQPGGDQGGGRSRPSARCASRAAGDDRCAGRRGSALDRRDVGGDLPLAREALADAPILLLCTHRPATGRPGTISPGPPRSSSGLSAPRRADRRARRIGPAAARDAPGGTILGRGEGNPFFLEELARAAGDQGDLGVAGARDRPGRPDGADRPPAREPRRVLQTASVLGREFSPRLLGTIWVGAGSWITTSPSSGAWSSLRAPGETRRAGCSSTR